MLEGSFIINICFPIVGLLFNFSGAIELAFSFTPTDKVGTHTDDSGKTKDFVLVGYDKRRFIFGVGMMAMGFLLQLIAVVLKVG